MKRSPRHSKGCCAPAERRWAYGLLAIALTLAACGGAAIADAPRWTPAWSDDFDTVDRDRWTVVSSTEPTNKSRHAYLPEQVTAENGKLVITSTDRPHRGLPFRSGQVISRSEQRLGRWEVRAKMPTSRGMWPAIWLLPDVARHAWPSGGEIDILENRGDQPRLTSSAFHYGSSRPYEHKFVTREQRTAINGELANYHDRFHTYAVDWTERYLRFYVDDVHHYTVHDEDVDRFLSEHAQPMQLVINNAIGGTFLDDPDGTTRWPQRMEIDWVRVFTLAEEPGVASFVNGGFESGGGSLAGWSLFGHRTETIQNATASGDAFHDGDSSLKLFGTFGAGERHSGVQQGVTVTPGDRVTVRLSATVRSANSIAGSDNRAVLKIDFYDRFGGKYGSPSLLEEHDTLIADGATENDVWLQRRLRVTAPPDAVEARVGLVFDQPSMSPGAVSIDAVSVEVGRPGARQVNSSPAANHPARRPSPAANR
ncbi:MAG: family 16 glycosylhydrolase [Planctomycetota bacterium]